MTESKVVNEWIREAVAKTRLEAARRYIIELLEIDSLLWFLPKSST